MYPQWQYDPGKLEKIEAYDGILTRRYLRAVGSMATETQEVAGRILELFVASKGS